MQTARRRRRDRPSQRPSEHPRPAVDAAEVRLPPPRGAGPGRHAREPPRGARHRRARAACRRLRRQHERRRRRGCRQPADGRPEGQAARGPARHLQLVGVRRPVDVQEVRGAPRRERGRPQDPRDVLLVERRAARQAARGRHRVRHRRPEPERRGRADPGRRADEARLQPDPEHQEPRPEVPQVELRPDGRVPRHQGLRHHDVLLPEHRREALDRAEDDEGLLRPPERERLEGPHERARRGRGGRPPRRDGPRIQREHGRPVRAGRHAEVPALDPQGRDHDQLVRLHQRRLGRQDHPEPGLERRRAPDPEGAQEGGRHHGGHPHREVRGVGRQLVRPGDGAAPRRGPCVDQLAARADDGGHGDGVPQLPDPDPGGARPDAAPTPRTTRSSTCRPRTRTTTSTS